MMRRALGPDRQNLLLSSNNAFARIAQWLSSEHPTIAKPLVSCASRFFRRPDIVRHLAWAVGAPLRARAEARVIDAAGSNRMMRKLKGLRWWIVGLICLGTVINYLARNSLAVLAPVLQTKLNFSTQEYSYVVAAFQVGYTVMQSVCGYVLDFLWLKLGFALFAVLWSGANLLHALAGGWGSLAFFRGLLGLSEAAAIPAGIKAISEWFPAKERSVAVVYFNAGTSLAALLAPPLCIWFLVRSSWQMAFIVTGGLGFVFALLWWLFYRTPRNHWLLGDRERDYILACQ